MINILINSIFNNSIKFSNNNSTFRTGINNDSSLSCFVKRIKVVPFTKPIPEHYIKTNGNDYILKHRRGFIEDGADPLGDAAENFYRKMIDKHKNTK